MKSLFVFGALLATSGFAMDGKKLYSTKLCVTCHGAEKAKPLAPIYPSLFGKKADCLEKEYAKIKSGKRAGMAAVMKAQIATVKDAEAQAIMKWAASQAKVEGVVEPGTTVCK